jgi:O6-methylguanine-DNA--protein-cysteine methyltransferase
VPADHRHLETLKTELQGYFAGTVRNFSVPVIAPGTDFEERV